MRLECFCYLRLFIAVVYLGVPLNVICRTETRVACVQCGRRLYGRDHVIDLKDEGRAKWMFLRHSVEAYWGVVSNRDLPSGQLHQVPAQCM